MAEQYVHTLIAEPNNFVPTAAQVQEFLSALVDRNVIPGSLCITLRTPTGETRTVVNPFTQGTLELQIKNHDKLGGIDEIEAALSPLADYEIEVNGHGRPKTPPLPISFDEPFHVAVTVRVSSVLRSTSESDETGVGYGEPCSTPQPSGFFTNPHSSKLIEVRGAGCARFWVEVQLGKFLFPEIPHDNLDILNPTVISAATKAFGVPFVQGLAPNG